MHISSSHPCLSLVPNGGMRLFSQPCVNKGVNRGGRAVKKRLIQAAAPIRADVGQGSGGYKLVADAAFADDAARRLRIGLELLAQAPDVHLEVVDLGRVVAPPDLGQERVVRQDAAGVAREVEEQRILRGSEGNG